MAAYFRSDGGRKVLPLVSSRIAHVALCDRTLTLPQQTPQLKHFVNFRSQTVFANISCGLNHKGDVLTLVSEDVKHLRNPLERNGHPNLCTLHGA